MLNTLFILKKPLGKLTVKQKNPLALNCKKITETPRTFSTSQITNATENILLVDVEENILPEGIISSIEYLLRDLFIQMHQTGLYNRQFRLWKSMASITEISVFKLQKGFFKKKELNAYLVNLYIDPKSQCISVIIDKNKDINEFKAYIDKVIKSSNLNRLKGIFYFTNSTPDEHFINRMKLLTNVTDQISKYESIIQNTNDVRLNIVSYQKDNEIFHFKHIYPELKALIQSKS